MSHAAFLEAILAAPADDTPRLIYADWLDEHGDPDRAEFIRVQCELWAGTWSDQARLGALRRRERELFSCLYGDGLPGPFVPNLDGFVGRNSPHAHYRRGFVDSVTCPAADLLRHFDAVRACQPVTRVRLTDVPAVETCVTRAADACRLPGRRWRHPDELAPFLKAAGDTQRPRQLAHALLLAEWDGVDFELPPGPAADDLDARRRGASAEPAPRDTGRPFRSVPRRDGGGV